MLINDYLVSRTHDLRRQAIWYQEAAFEQEKVVFGQFFLDAGEERELVQQKK